MPALLLLIACGLANAASTADIARREREAQNVTIYIIRQGVDVRQLAAFYGARRLFLADWRLPCYEWLMPESRSSRCAYFGFYWPRSQAVGGLSSSP